MDNAVKNHPKFYSRFIGFYPLETALVLQTQARMTILIKKIIKRIPDRENALDFFVHRFAQFFHIGFVFGGDENTFSGV